LASDVPQLLQYKRSRFSTRLPIGLLYTASHYWLAKQYDGSWRIGFTKFAARMLGELVEFGFEVKPGDPVKVGQVIGWVEAFKAMSDVFAVVEGEFAGVNEALQANTELAQTDPYGAGWLYAARGTPEPNAVDVHGYVGILDGAIDKIQDKTP
jgi:glycine cleavage system H protein